jgi:hypothetical protein
MHLSHGHLTITKLATVPGETQSDLLTVPVDVERITVRDATNAPVDQVRSSQSGGFLYCSLREPEGDPAASPAIQSGSFHLDLVAQDSAGNRVQLSSDRVTLRNRMSEMLVYALPLFEITSPEQPACPRCGRMLTFTPRRRHDTTGSVDRWICRSLGAAFAVDDSLRMQQGGYDMNHRMPDARNYH